MQQAHGIKKYLAKKCKINAKLQKHKSATQINIVNTKNYQWMKHAEFVACGKNTRSYDNKKSTQKNLLKLQALVNWVYAGMLCKCNLCIHFHSYAFLSVKLSDFYINFLI